MPYPIKNSATLQTNSIKHGSFGLGVNQGGYGLTSSTAFWNGKTPNVSGYVLYIGNGASSPTTYVAKNDSDLITLSNVLGYGPNTTIGETLTTFNGQSNSVICVNMDCPNFVVGDLTLYLDAGFPPSYPKSGTKWGNISGTVAITADLYNGPTFNSDFYGSIVFDGSDNYADSLTVIPFPHNSAWSIQFIVKTNTFVNTYPGYLIQGNANTSGVLIFYTSDGIVYWKHNNIGYVITTTTFGEVYDIAITYSGSGNVKAYVNGVFVANVGTMASTDSTNTLLLGRGDQFSNHNQYTFLRYSRELSAAEVLQNYYAGLQRFIPTNGLVLWLDGTNTNTRVVTPTTAIDMSGNDYNGSLNNGMGLGHRDGGTTFSFDGVDDFINLGNVINYTTYNYSVSMWVKIPSSSSAFTTLFSKKGIAAANAGYAVYYNGGNRKLLWSNGDSTTAQEYYTISEIPLDQWINVICVRNVTPVPKGYFYINGLEYSITNNPTGLNVSNNYDLTIGKNSTGGLYLIGNIGDVRFYGRVITATEASTIYNAGRARYGL